MVKEERGRRRRRRNRGEGEGWGGRKGCQKNQGRLGLKSIPQSLVHKIFRGGKGCLSGL